MNEVNPEHPDRSATVAVVSVTSTRRLEDDPAGETIREIFAGTPHTITEREVIPDAYDIVQGTVESYIGDPSINTVITTGGVGVDPDDVTVDAIEPLFEKHLPGIGEQFRRLTLDAGEKMAITTRVTAGVAAETVLVCLPRTETGTRRGIEELLLPVLPQLLASVTTPDG